jgi:uncharacterized protein YecT (DUF1311 family)
MSKAGGIIGIIAGVFGFIAAIVTLFLGGIGSAFEAEGANTVIGLGWGGVLFSFLSIVFGAIAIARPKGAGVGLIVSSILGAVLGGTIVAFCMALSLIGGILAVVGAKKTPVAASTEEPVQNTPPANPSSSKKLYWIGGGIGLLVLVIGVALIAGKDELKSKADPLMELANAQPGNLQPEGELSELFTLGSKYTDLQRENKSKEVIGQVVQWRLPVYEVSKSKEGYKIQTRGSVSIGGYGKNLIGTFIHITPRDSEDRKIIENMKTDDVIAFKGRIAGTTMRMLTIKPAILIRQTQQAQNNIVPATPQSTDSSNPASDSGGQDLQNLKQMFAAADQEINDVYKGIMAQLSPGAKGELKSEQIAWIKQKERRCSAETEGANRLKCLISMTRERTQALKQYLSPDYE